MEAASGNAGGRNRAIPGRVPQATHSPLDCPYEERRAFAGLRAALRPVVKGKGVVIVNDVISAGSAVRGTYEDLAGADARVIAVGCLLLLGEAFPPFAEGYGLAVDALETAPHHLWTPQECPLCK